MTRIHLRATVALVAALLTLLTLGAVSASAHVNIASKTPSGTVTSARSATVTFTGQVRSGTIKVYKGSTKVSVGNGGRDPRNVRRLKTSINRTLSAGRYTVKWTIVAADGHRQSGSWSFTVR